MKINQSTIRTYTFPERIPGKPETHSVGKPEADRQVPVKEDSRGQAVPAAAGGPGLSDVLSSEEKEMIQALFPPSRQDFGIGAYRKIQGPVIKENVLGRKIDLKL